ncbi:MAG: MotA/TolQ/ExbB proton channel family protein [Planctomycetota bacterium]|nr:MotA/TolQ/ExbB proton channel family protein [Planctomycetota bacterium]
MKAILSLFFLLGLAATGFAQDRSDTEAVDSLARRAGQELQKGIEELNSLRDAIANEKVPLAQELSALETKLASLRAEHDRVSRTVDSGNLEVANLAVEKKSRQDDLGYVASRLDEYVRTFESKIDVSELQYCGEQVEAAKKVAENTAMTMAEKFEVQLALVTTTLQRAFLMLGGHRFPGTAVNMAGEVVAGEFALIGPIALFRDAAGAAGLVVAQPGSKRPLVRPLEGEAQAGMATLVQQGEGDLPVDTSRGGALKALVQRTNLFHIFEKGGPIMWPLLFLSVLALGVVLERLLFLANERRKRDHKALGQLLAAAEQGNLAGAIAVGNTSKYFVVRALGYALSHREGSLPNALVYAQAQELKRFKRGIPILDTVITLAPLLGLLGTVTGMMGSFSIIGGELSSPGAITGGIAEALIATAFGLGIAITALIPFNFLNSRLDDASHEIESAATQLELLVQTRAAQAPTRREEAVVA